MRHRPSEIAGISPTEFAVYRFVIAYKSDHDGNSPTARDIAAGIGLSYHSAVPTWLRKLERAGLLRLKRSGDSNRIAEIYVVGGKWLPPQNGATTPNNQEGDHAAT